MKTITLILFLLTAINYVGATKGFRMQPRAVYDVEGEIVGYANWCEYNMNWVSDNCEVVNIYFRFLADSTSQSALRTGNRWNVDCRNRWIQNDSVQVQMVSDTLNITPIW